MCVYIYIYVCMYVYICKIYKNKCVRIKAKSTCIYERKDLILQLLLPPSSAAAGGP